MSAHRALQTKLKSVTFSSDSVKTLENNPRIGQVSTKFNHTGILQVYGNATFTENICSDHKRLNSLDFHRKTDDRNESLKMRGTTEIFADTIIHHEIPLDSIEQNLTIHCTNYLMNDAKFRTGPYIVKIIAQKVTVAGSLYISKTYEGHTHDKALDLSDVKEIDFRPLTQIIFNIHRSEAHTPKTGDTLSMIHSTIKHWNDYSTSLEGSLYTRGLHWATHDTCSGSIIYTEDTI